uniref:Uncharacterized protein n=1 Tax=Romanomermis culicivorax TaxID=13658 RepID=A0A915HKP3_ROMCU
MDKKIDGLQELVKKQSDLLKELKNTTLWLVEKVNIAPVINNIYIPSGQSVIEFVKELVKKVYGDLLAVYKFNVQCNYADSNQRK